MNVFLSYGERDMLRNKRYTTTTDAPNGFGAEEHPLLSLYVMKSTMPDRRYVGVLSPSCMQVLTTTPPPLPHRYSWPRVRLGRLRCCSSRASALRLCSQRLVCLFGMPFRPLVLTCRITRL